MFYVKNSSLWVSSPKRTKKSIVRTAISGTILVSDLVSGNTSYVWAMVALAVLALIGLAAAIRLPGTATEQG